MWYLSYLVSLFTPLLPAHQQGTSLRWLPPHSKPKPSSPARSILCTLLQPHCSLLVPKQISTFLWICESPVSRRASSLEGSHMAHTLPWFGSQSKCLFISKAFPDHCVKEQHSLHPLCPPQTHDFFSMVYIPNILLYTILAAILFFFFCPSLFVSTTPSGMQTFCSFDHSL